MKPLAWLLFVFLVGTRIFLEFRAGLISGGLGSSFVASRFDPRGFSAVDQAGGERESDAFKNRLAQGSNEIWHWPGLASVQVSYSWLELLQAVHVESSYSGDFSWVFSKLDRIYRSTPTEETSLTVALAPFYFLMNKDGAGATYLMNSILRRNPTSWKIWFWSGFHALENLKNSSMAGDLYRHAALIEGSPLYLGALSFRLSNRDLFLRVPSPKHLAEKDLPENLVEKIRKTRPEWFK